jgi:hypothetical protein
MTDDEMDQAMEQLLTQMQDLLERQEKVIQFYEALAKGIFAIDRLRRPWWLW